MVLLVDDVVDAVPVDQQVLLQDEILLITRFTIFLKIQLNEYGGDSSRFNSLFI